MSIKKLKLKLFQHDNKAMDEKASDFWTRTNRLIKLRKSKQESIALECGIPYQTFRGWVARRVYPDALEAVRIASVLETSVEFLVTGQESDPETKKSDELKEKIIKEKIIEFVRNL